MNHVLLSILVTALVAYFTAYLAERPVRKERSRLRAENKVHVELESLLVRVGMQLGNAEPDFSRLILNAIATARQEIANYDKRP